MFGSLRSLMLGLAVVALLQFVPSALGQSTPPFWINGDFSKGGAGGAPSGWEDRTKTGGVTIQKEGELCFVRLSVEKNADGRSNFLQQIAKVPADAKRLKFSTRFRYQGVEVGARKHEHGIVQARYMQGGKEIGGYVDLSGTIAGDHSTWQEVSRTADVPDDADAIMFRIGFYGVKGGQMDVASADISVITVAEVAADVAKYRPPQPYGEPVSDARFAKLAKGVNMDKWFMEPYNGKLNGEKGAFTAQYLRGFVTDQDVALLKSAGMTNVRLPVDPAAFMDKETGKLDPALLGELDFAITRFEKAGMGVQVDAHVHLPALRGMAAAPEVADKLVTWWTGFADHLSKTTDPEFVFLEVLNEPGGVGFYGAGWSAFQDRLITAIRAAAPKHTLIANGGGYMLWDKDTIKLTPHPDRNIIYAVHYYEPSQFTHQGAPWMKPMYQPLRNVPWPCDESNLQAALDSIVHQGWTGRLAGADKAAEEFLKNMVKDGLGTPKRMNENFDHLTDWAKKNGVRVVINEFGVYVPYAPADSRFRWMADVRKTAESHGFGWAHWDYCTGMPIVTGEPGARQFDPQAAAALGLNANAGK